MLLEGREEDKSKTTMREFKRVEDALEGIWIGTLSSRMLVIAYLTYLNC